MPEPEQGEDTKNDATRRAAPGAVSHVFAHVLAVSALLIIAACIFYVR